MQHFTLTGMQAGAPLCEQARNEVDTYVHLPITSQLQFQISKHGAESICPACLYEWLRTYSDESCDPIEDLTPEQFIWDAEVPQWVRDLAHPTYTRLPKK